MKATLISLLLLSASLCLAEDSGVIIAGNAYPTGATDPGLGYYVAPHQPLIIPDYVEDSGFPNPLYDNYIASETRRNEAVTNYLNSRTYGGSMDQATIDRINGVRGRR